MRACVRACVRAWLGLPNSVEKHVNEVVTDLSNVLADFLFPCFLVFPPANLSNFSHCKCFSSRIDNAVIVIFAFFIAVLRRGQR